MICTRLPSLLIVLRVEVRKTASRRLASRLVGTRGNPATLPQKPQISTGDLVAPAMKGRVHPSGPPPRRRFSGIAPVELLALASRISWLKHAVSLRRPLSTPKCGSVGRTSPVAWIRMTRRCTLNVPAKLLATRPTLSSRNDSLSIVSTACSACMLSDKSET